MSEAAYLMVVMAELLLRPRTPHFPCGTVALPLPSPLGCTANTFSLILTIIQMKAASSTGDENAREERNVLCFAYSLGESVGAPWLSE